MSDEPRYQPIFSGQFRDGVQIAVGQGNQQDQRIEAAPGERLDATELEALKRELDAIRALVAMRASHENQDAALGRIDELESATVGAAEPEPRRIARVYRWFLDNVPDLAESVSSLLLGPLVGKLVGGGAGAMAAALGAEAKPRS